MNEYDSQKMADLLDATNGYQLTEEAADADVILLRQKQNRLASANLFFLFYSKQISIKAFPHWEEKGMIIISHR